MASPAREVLEHRLVGVPAGEHPLIQARGGLDAVEVVVAIERADRLQAQRHRALAKARRPTLDRSKSRFIARAQPAEETAEVLDRHRIPGELVDVKELPPQRERTGVGLHRVRRPAEHPQVLQILLRRGNDTVIAVEHRPRALTARQHQALRPAGAEDVVGACRSRHRGGGSCRRTRTTPPAQRTCLQLHPQQRQQLRPYAPVRETGRQCASPGAHHYGLRRVLTQPRGSAGADSGERARRLSEDGAHACRMSAARTDVERPRGGPIRRLPRFGRSASPAHEQTMPNRCVEPHGRTPKTCGYCPRRHNRIARQLAVRLAAGVPSARCNRPSAEPEPEASGIAATSPVVRAVRAARARSSLRQGRRAGGRPS